MPAPSPGSRPRGRTDVSRGHAEQRPEAPVEPRLPHEHDQSDDSQAAQADEPRGPQAYEDLKRGVRDTDRGPVADATYHRLRDGEKR